MRKLMAERRRQGRRRRRAGHAVAPLLHRPPSSFHHTIAPSAAEMSRSAVDRKRRRDKSAGTAVAISHGMTKRLLLAAVSILFTACEHGIDMEGTVVVPTDVQQRFSPEAPGQLFVVAKLPAEPARGAAGHDPHLLLCRRIRPRSIVVRGFRFACAEAGIAQVAAYAVPSTADLIDCAGGTVKPQRMYAPDTFEPGDALAVGKVDAPIQADGSGCADGHITFTLTLARCRPQAPERARAEVNR
jgi:hypothetical protein